MHIFKLGPFLQVESRLPKLVVAECFGNMGLLKAMLSPCVWNSALSLSFSLCLSLALYLIIVVPCSHLWLFCLPNLQLRTRIAAIKALCDQQKGWVRWLGPGIVIHIYIYIWIIWDGMPTPPFLQLLGHCCCQTMTSWGETSMRSRWSFTGLSSRSVAGSWC